MKEQIKLITADIELPEGISFGDLSRKYPKIYFNMTNGHEISKDERIIYIKTKEWKKEYFNFLKKHKETVAITAIGNVIKIHIKSSILKRLEQKKITIFYPTMLKKGIHRIKFLADKKQLESLNEVLSDVRIIKITDSEDNKTELTEHQKELLWQAYSLGYYKYPRGITLTNLAKLLKISKATLSQTLRIVENKAIKQLLEK